MKIINKEVEKIYIRDLNIGDTFIDDHELFMLCRYEGEDINCPRCDEDISIHDHIDFLAVNLANGEIFNFSGYREIILVECEAMIK